MKKIIVYLLIFLITFNGIGFAQFSQNKTFVDPNTGEIFNLSKNESYFNKVEKNKYIQRKRIEIRGHIGLYNPESRVKIPEEYGEGFLIGYYELEEEIGNPQNSKNKIVITDEKGQEKIIGFFDKKVSKEIFSDGSFDIIHSEGIHTTNNNNDISYEKHHFNPNEEKTGITIGVQEGKEIFEETYNMKGKRIKTRYGLLGDDNTIKMYKDYKNKKEGIIVEKDKENYKEIVEYDEYGNLIKTMKSKIENIEPKKDDFKGFEGSIMDKYKNNSLLNDDFIKDKESFLNGTSGSLFDSMGIDGSFENMKRKIQW
jgi:hypothetical protein